MPSLAQTYALQTGLQIGEPLPQEHFYPIPASNYILVNASSGMGSKNYDYFNEVIRLLKAKLPDEFKFVQIGNKDDVPLTDAVHLQGMTTISQMMFLIKHCRLLIGNDSCGAHIASSYNKPIVALYGATHPRIHGPEWGDKTKQKLLEPERNGKKPTYTAQEAVKAVNQILPEQIVNSALSALGLEPDLTLETLHLGGKYHGVTLELVCNQILRPQDFPNVVLNARMDYHFDENFLFNNLMHRPMCIVTDHPINVEVLKQLRKNVAMIVYIIDETYDVGFIERLRGGGLPYNVVANLEGDALANAKLELFDLANVIPRRKIQKTDLEKHAKITTTTLYRSNRFILSDGKIFLNKISLRDGISCSNQRDNEGVVIDDPEFWEDADYFYIFNP